MKLIKRIPIWLIFLIPPMLMILPGVDSFHVATGTEFNDIEISHYPNLLLIQQTMINRFGIPLWNPYILGGYPFDGDPLSGLWYPANWLVLFFPILIGINLSVLIHVFLGGVGIYRLMQKLGIGKGTAVVIGLLFTTLPKIYAHFGAGHYSYLTAFCLTPWLCSAALSKSKYAWIAQALLIGAMALADIRWLPFGVTCWIACLISRKNNGFKDPARNFYLSAAGWLACGLIICTGFLFALLQFSQFTTRSTLSVNDVSELALPASRLFTIFFPSFGVTPEWMVYLGMGLPLMAMVGMLRGKPKNTLVWVILTIGCILFSLGSQIPGFSLLSQIPGFDMMRVPSRMMFIANLSILILAGYGLDSFRTGFSDHKWILWVNAIFLISAGRIIWLALQRQISGVELWFLPIIVLLAIMVFVWLKQTKNISFNFLSFCLALFLLMDIGLISRFSFTEKVIEKDLPADVLSTFPNFPRGRIYSPDYAIGQSIGAENGIAFAQGVHPLQLRGYVDYLSKASGVESTGYSVVQPPLKTGNPRVDNLNAMPDEVILARLNVSHIISHNPIKNAKLISTYQESNIWVYENSVYADYPMISELDEKPLLLRATPNSLEYQVTGPGRFATSDVFYPGWRAKMDGKYQQMIKELDLFRSVDIPAGEHFLQFTYHPTFTYLGFCLGMICLLVLTSKVLSKSDE